MQSNMDLITRKIFRSSANSSLPEEICWHKSLMKRTKISGPNTLPCGTPDGISNFLERAEFTWTNALLPVKYDINQSDIQLGKPICLSFSIAKVCGKGIECF